MIFIYFFLIFQKNILYFVLYCIYNVSIENNNINNYNVSAFIFIYFLIYLNLKKINVKLPQNELYVDYTINNVI